MKTPGERVNVVACAKCHSEQYLTFHPAMAHQFSSVLGYLDVQGCMAFDLILPECDFSLGCLNCSNQMAVGVSTMIQGNGCAGIYLLLVLKILEPKLASASKS